VSSDGSLPATDPFAFIIKVVPTPNSSNPNSADITFAIKNNTAKTITFPGNLTVTVTITQAGSTQAQTYVLQPKDSNGPVSSIAPGEKITSNPTTATVLGSGTFTASATCDVDYGS
jgi:hypothetical protein